MIKVTMSGKNVKVIRSYHFKNGSPLPDFHLDHPYELKLTLAGIDAAAPSAKKIIAGFPKAYEAAVSKAAKSRNGENDAIWKAAGKAIANGTEPMAVEKETQTKLQKRWAEFEKKVLIPTVDDVVANLALAELEKSEAKKVKARSNLFSSSKFFEKFSIIKGLSGVSGGAVLTVAAGASLAAIVPALATIAAILGTLSATRKLSEKVYTDININLKRVDKELENVASALAKLEANLVTLDKQKEKLGYLMIKKDADIKKLEKEFTVLAAKADKDIVPKKQVDDLRAKIKSLKGALATEKAERSKLVTDTKTVSDLVKHSAIASQKFAADRSKYDKVLSFGDTFAKAISAIEVSHGTIDKGIKKYV